MRKWRSGRGAKLNGVTVGPAANHVQGRPAAPASPPPAAHPEFVALEMPAAPKAKASTAASRAEATAIAASLIHVELRRGALQLNVRWPTAAAEDCRAWLRELTPGLLK